MANPIILPELVVPGRRLGRQIHHDPRSLRYALPTSAAKSVEWERHIPILDQGNVGSCTGNATVGALASGPLYDALVAAGFVDPQGVHNWLILDEKLALAIYSAAEKLDGGAGLPSEDQGSSGLSVAKVADTDGYISGYQHATSIGAANTAIQAGPFIQGTYWMTGMDDPSAEGIVTATGTIRGGHEYMCREYDATRDLWWYDNSWGTSYGAAGRFAMSSETLEKLLAKSGDITSLVPLSGPAPTPSPAPVHVALAADDVATLDAWGAARHTGSNARAAAAWNRATATASLDARKPARRFHDAGTGHYVSEQFAADNPTTTFGSNE